MCIPHFSLCEYYTSQYVKCQADNSLFEKLIDKSQKVNYYILRGDLVLMIKLLREERGIMQKKMAQDLGIGLSTLSQYETGKREPDISTIIKIADYFNVSTDYLLGKTDFKTKSNSNDSIDINNLSPEAQQKAREYVAMLETLDKLKPNEKPADFSKKA